jgi:hypothetical protein
LPVSRKTAIEQVNNRGTIKNCPAYILCQTKTFHLRMVKICAGHHKTHANKGEKPQVVNSNSKDETIF